MEGRVQQEKEKYERLFKEMESKEKDIAVKSDKLRKVHDLVKNSPQVANKTVLKESTTPNVKVRKCVQDLSLDFSCC